MGASHFNSPKKLNRPGRITGTWTRPRRRSRQPRRVNRARWRRLSRRLRCRVFRRLWVWMAALIIFDEGPGGVYSAGKALGERVSPGY